MELPGIFIAYPLAALPVAAVFAILWALKRKVMPGVAAVLWTGYACYEYLMHARILCTGECNIRVDLLLLYPVLLLVSLLAVIGTLRGKSDVAGK